MKPKPWEGIAVDLVYQDNDAVTVAVLPRSYTPEQLNDWITHNIERPKIGKHVFVYSYDVTIH